MDPFLCTPPLNNPLSYQAYKMLAESLQTQHNAADADLPDSMAADLRLNLQRLKRAEKNFTLLPEVQELLAQHRPAWHWVVLADARCSECAQVLPTLAAITALVPTITMSVLLREENPAWMKACFPYGKDFVPKLICLDAELYERLFCWYPRTAAQHKNYLTYRSQHAQLTREEAVWQLKKWHAKERSKTIQRELLALMEQELHYVPGQVAGF